MTNSQLHVVRSGSLTTVQDLGRPGFAHLAVPRSGAVDRSSLTLANRLVGNSEQAAALETTVDGVAVRFDQSRYIAVTGAEAPVLIDGRPASWGVPQRVRAGQLVDVGRARRGVRSYLAVAGGIDTMPVMGSRATDLLSGLGPPIVSEGTTLRIGQPTGPSAALDFAPYRLPEPELLLDCYLGPRDDWITREAIEIFARSRWQVTTESNRIALRLKGVPLARRITDELLSEGVALGSVQVPANGQPVVFLSDHPTTGGYPVIGVVPAPDIWRCGQAMPGTSIRFRIKRLEAL
jgi:biotin-dependent carboxylase-like uncharacterized protein